MFCFIFKWHGVYSVEQKWSIVLTWDLRKNKLKVKMIYFVGDKGYICYTTE